MYLARYNYYDDNGTLKKVEFIDENDYDSKEEFLEAIWYSRYGYTNQQFYLNDRNKILGVLDYIAKQVGLNRVLSEEDKIELLKLSLDYSKYISRNRIIELLSSGEEPFDIVNSIRGYITSKLPLKKDVISVKNFIKDNMNKSMWELNSERAVLNRLLQIFSSTLTSPNHFIDATTPLDVTTAPLQAIAKSMKKYFEINGEMQDLGPLFPAYLESMKAKNTGADNGIGPMALINVFRTFMQIADMHLVGVTDSNGINIVQELGIDNLNKVYDDEGLSILDWTSALINAHVDAAKDPYVIRLNVNKYTYNMTAFMISAGFGRSTFYFLPQPILRDLATRYMHLTSSEIGVEAWERYSKKYMSDTIEDYESMIDKGQPTRVPLNTVLSNIRNVEWLEKQLSTPESQRDNTWYATLLTILDVYNSLSTYADAIRDCINAVLIDTKKFGTNANELILFLHLVEKVLNNPLIANPQDLFDKTFLRRKYDNSIKLLFDLFSDLILDFSPEFINIVEELLKYTKTYYSRKVDKINTIANEVKSSIYAHFFNQYLTDHNMSVRELFFGDKSIVNRVARLLEDIASGKYRELADNEFILMLLPNVLNNDTTPMSFENSITKLRDTDSKNAYTFAWMDLLEHEDPEIRKLGNDLIVYSFYLGGGLQSGIYNFYDLAPYGYLANLQLGNGETFLQYMKKILVDFNTQVGLNNSLINEIYEDVFRNSWRNNDIIPEFKLNSKALPIKVLNDGKQITYIKFPSKATSFLKTLNGTYRPFVRLANTGNPNTTNIYRLVGYFANPNSDEILLVYGRANKLGYSHQGFKIKESGTTQLPSNIGEEFTNPTLESFKTSFLDGDIFVPVQPFSGSSIDNSATVEESVTPEGDTEVTNPVLDFDNFVLLNSDTNALDKATKEGKKIKEQCEGE